MNTKNAKNDAKSRYEEIVEILALLPEEQLRSYCLNEDDAKTVKKILDFKRSESSDCLNKAAAETVENVFTYKYNY